MKHYIIILISFLITSFGWGQTQKQYPQKELTFHTKLLEAQKNLLMGREDKAKEVLTELQNEDRTRAVVDYYLYKVYMSEKNTDEAYRYIVAAHRKEKNNQAYLYQKAKLALEIKKYDVAIESYTALNALDTDNTEYFKGLIDAQHTTQNYAEALRLLDLRIEQRGLSPDLGRQKVGILLKRKNTEGAIKVYDALIDAYPNNIRLLEEYVDFLHKEGNLKKEDALYRKILSLDPNHANANLYLTKATKEEPSNSSKSMGLDAIISNPNITINDKLLEATKALMSYNQNKDETLLPSLQSSIASLVENNPSEPGVHSIMGDLKVLQKDYAQASTSYKKSLSLNRKTYNTWEKLMECYDQLGNTKALKELAYDAIDFFPNQATAYLMYGKTVGGEEGIEYIDEGILVAGGIPGITSELLLQKAILTKDRDPETAKELLQEALDLNSENSRARQILDNLK